MQTITLTLWLCVVTLMISQPCHGGRLNEDESRNIREADKRSRTSHITLEETVKKLEKDVRKLKEVVKKRDEDVKKLKEADKKREEAEKKMDKLNTKLQAEITGRKAADVCLSQTIGFMASLTQSGSDLEFSGGQTVVYPKVITNVGNAYNPGNGRFTATAPGLYAFSVTAHTAMRNDTSALNIKVNDRVVTSEFVWNTPGGVQGTGAARAVVALSKDDVVSVETDSHYHTHTLTQYIAMKINVNTFSGELVQPDCPQ